MKKSAVLLAVLLIISMAAADNRKEIGCMENAGKVMSEILNIFDNIPQSLLDKAECVVVLFSVMKVAFVVGANFGCGVMTCCGGAKFDGLWGASTMIALKE